VLVKGRGDCALRPQDHAAHALKARAAHRQVEVETAELDGALTAADVVDLNTGEVVVRPTSS
jgi:DNA-directed RNA polymerase subunit beta